MKVNPMNQNWSKDQLTSKANKASKQDILEKRSGLSVDDFLKIMAAEMQNQSPMGSSESGGGSKTDYISQLAQFTSLEQMGDIVENLNYLNAMSQQQYAFSLIGKDVSLRVQSEDGNKMVDIVGSVQKVKFKDGIPLVTVDGKDYELGSIMEVGEKGQIKTEESSDSNVEEGDNNEL